MKNIVNKTILILFISAFFGCSDLDDNLKLGNLNDVIQKDSELFTMLTKVTGEGNNPTQVIACLDFIYPFTLVVYDSNLVPISSKVLTGDIQFSAFLSNFPENQSISLSYPINTSLADGTIFSVNSNAELKNAIDSCSKEDIINYCSDLFGGCNCSESICVWKTTYWQDFDNLYAGGVFETNNDGTLNFKYEDEILNGTWTFLFVNNKLHININLEGNSAIAQYWNIDREIELTEDSITILNTTKKIFLRKSCESNEQYSVGMPGPAGGLVFYDKGFYSFGWRYLEAAPEDLNNFEWGCMGTEIQNSNNIDIGKGLINSILIANFHDNLTNYYLNPSICNALNNGTVIAKKALLLEINEFNDWFLPSQNELEKMYQNLKIQNLGNLANSKYWSSSQIDATSVHIVDFVDGTNGSETKIPTSNNIKARAVRYF